ncbi:MAG: cytidylate kinase-like family protein [Lachnospira sp.]|nr:cytidylate kinase-like family protein [Lachnospira sp.]
MNNTIITIGRQFGSGGREIGEKLSKKLDIPFYDKDLLKRAAKESGLCEEIFENFDEKPSSSFLYSLVMDPYSLGYSNNGFDLPLNHKVFLAAFDTIKKIADEGACIIVGRCADYVLQDYTNCINLFIHAPLEDRIKRISMKYDLPENKAKDMIYKKDKQRASYYNYYSNSKWADIKNYHLSINSSMLGIDGTVDMIEDIIKRKK